MLTRSLTDAYLLMRNNALQSRHMFWQRQEVDYEYEDDNDEINLISSQKSAPGGAASFQRGNLSPKWMTTVDEIQDGVSKIKLKMEELSAHHHKHLNRPTLDDDVEEEHTIDILTQEITHIFYSCNTSVKNLVRMGERAKNQEKVFAKNVTHAMGTSLQNLSNEFRQNQSSYLKKLKAREDRSKHFFNMDSAIMIEQDEMDIDDETFERGFSASQAVAVGENSRLIEEREKEIQSVVQSITDLSEIFQDLSKIVVEQGTILDRIDYNVEHSVVKTEQGLTQLRKAEEYQKKNKKLYIIFGLAVITVIMLIILIVTRSH